MYISQKDGNSTMVKFGDFDKEVLPNRDVSLLNYYSTKAVTTWELLVDGFQYGSLKVN